MEVLTALLCSVCPFDFVCVCVCLFVYVGGD